MNFVKKYFFFICLFLISSLNARNFNEWYSLCKNKLPLFRQTGKNYSNTALTIEELNSTIDEYLTVIKNSNLADSSLWQKNPPKITDNFFTSSKPLNPIQPFVQKLVFDPGTIISFHGDFHGDIHSLLEFIKYLQTNGYMDKYDGFKIKDNKFKIVFLGDYTDRGNFGVEVLYTIMWLKIKNPESVFMVRGNHEDISITMQYGFYDEFKTKFKNVKNLDYYFNKLTRIYDVLPVVIYLGVKTGKSIDFIQCCHGGMELGYDPKVLLANDLTISYQWLEELWQLKNYNSCCNADRGVCKYLKDFKINNFYSIGFMWNDFQVSPKLGTAYCPGRGFGFGKCLTQQVLDFGSTQERKIRGVFRAHQHTAEYSDMMLSMLEKGENLGLSKLWQDKSCKTSLWNGIVCTFLVGPDSVYGQPNQKGYQGFNFDAFGILYTNSKFEQWTLTVHRNMIVNGIM